MCRTKDKSKQSTYSRPSRKTHRRVHEVAEDSASYYSDSEEGDSFYVGSVAKNTVCEDDFNISLMVAGDAWNCKIDSGADVTCAPVSCLHPDFPLLKPLESLNGADQQKLRIFGMQNLPIQYKGKTSYQNIYFIKDQYRILLGKPAIKSFHLVRRINSVAQSCALPKSVENKYAELFKGIGKMPGEYKIVLKEDAKPFQLTVPRRIPFPLQSRVKTTLQKME